MDISTLIRPIKNFVLRYHPTIFFTFIGLLLATAIFMLTQVLDIPNTPDENAQKASTISGVFDKKTIEQVRQLRASNESTGPLVFPQPRSNPFSE